MTPIKKAAMFGALLAMAGAGRLSAAVLVEEAFDYANGSLHAKSGGSGFSGNWSFGTNGTGTVTVADGAAVLAGANATWATRNVDPIQGSSFYFSYEVSSAAAASLASRSFLDVLAFKSSGSILFQTGMYYDTYGVRLRATAGGTDVNLTTAASTTLNTVYTVVGKFTFNDGAGNAVLSLWLNASDEGSATVYTKTWASALTSVTQIVLQRYDSYQVGEGSSTVFDDIRIGTDWASVTPIPEPRTAAGLAGAAGIALAAMLRRR